MCKLTTTEFLEDVLNHKCHVEIYDGNVTLVGSHVSLITFQRNRINSVCFVVLLFVNQMYFAVANPQSMQHCNEALARKNGGVQFEKR